jgi:hypothetical protein
VMRVALDLRRAVAGVLHHAPDGVHGDLDPLPTQLIADLARPEAGVLASEVEDLPIARGLDIGGIGSGGRRVALALGGEADAPAPRIEREAADAEVGAGLVYADAGGDLERPGLLGGRVEPGDVRRSRDVGGWVGLSDRCVGDAGRVGVGASAGAGSSGVGAAYTSTPGRASWTQRPRVPSGMPSSLAAAGGPISSARAMAACFSAQVQLRDGAMVAVLLGYGRPEGVRGFGSFADGRCQSTPVTSRRRGRLAAGSRRRTAGLEEACRASLPTNNLEGLPTDFRGLECRDLTATRPGARDAGPQRARLTIMALRCGVP